MKYVVSSILFSVLSASAAMALSGAERCALDLCGPMEKFEARGDNGRHTPVSNEVASYISQKFLPSYSTVLDLEVQSFEQQAKFILEKTKTNANIKLSTEQKSILLGLYLETAFPGLEKAVITGANGAPELSPETVKTLMPDISDADRELIRQFVLRKVASFAYDVARITSNWSLETVLSVVLKVDLDKSPEQVSKVLEALHVAAVEMNKTFGEALFSSRHVKFLASVKKLSSFSRYQKTYLAEIINKMFELGPYGDSDTKILEIAEQYPLDVPKVLNVLSQVSRADYFVNVMADSSYVAEIKDDTSYACSNVVKRSLGAAPSTLKARQARELNLKVKAAGQRAAVRYFSGEALKIAQNAISAAKVMPVDNLEEFNQRVDTMVKRQRLDADEVRRQVQLAGKSELQTASVLLASLRRAVKSQDGVLEPLLKSCKKLVMDDFSDQAFSDIGIVETSWQTANYFEIGAGVLAHEIGHVVDAAIKNSKITGAEVAGYKESRTCNVESQKPVMAIFKRPEAEAENYLQEDWADTFAGSTVKELSKEWPYTTSFMCSFMGAFWPYMYADDISPLGGPRHSPVLLRAMKIQMSRGEKVPASCKKLLPKDEIKNILRTCEN